MTTFFNTVQITNFKSLKNVTLSDCKRINLLIGKPNVGKSNILEAIGLFSVYYFRYNKSKKLTQFVRFENISELFFDGDIDNQITITTDDYSSCIIKYLKPLGRTDKALIDIKTKVRRCYNGNLYDDNVPNIYVDKTFNIYFPPYQHTARTYIPIKVKYYKFPHSFLSKKQGYCPSFLIPPVGVNLLEAIQESKIDSELSKIFSEYGLKLLFDKTNQTLRIDKPLKDGAASFPLSSIADTLQRLIFFKTAIASNENSILLFEEPEAHCFPPYITHIAKEIISSESNQFFIATHSPYILDTFLEKDRNDLAIYMADFKDGQTVIKRLTDAELNDVYEYGLDLFFNAELFTDEI